MPYIITGILAISPWHIMMIRFSLMWGVYMKSNKRYMNCITALLCFCTTLFFNISFSQPEITGDAGVIYSVFENLRLSMRNDFFMMTIVFLIFYYINQKINRYEKLLPWGLTIINILIALVWLMAESFLIENTTYYIYCSPAQIVKSIIYVIGAVHLLNCLAKLLYMFIISALKNTESFDTDNFFCKCYNKHPYLLTLICLLILWMPNTIISHPASIEYDVWDSIMQYYGDLTITSHHPPVYTVFVGWFTKLGIALGDINIGFFVYIVLQTIVASMIVSYLLNLMRELQSPKWLRIATFVIAVLSPYYTSYIATIIKDVPYSYAVLLFVIELVYFHLMKERYFIKGWHVGLLWLSVLTMTLFRYNGKYVVGFMLLYFVIQLFFHISKPAKKHIIKIIIALSVPLLLASGISKFAIVHYNVLVQEKDSLRETLSVPFQQTARYIKTYPDEISEEEKQSIDVVLGYEGLADAYNPNISDPVKARFNTAATYAQIGDYFKTWFIEFCKHPFTYIEATINQNFYIIYPMKENIKLYDSTYVDYFWYPEYLDMKGAAKEMTFEAANSTRISIYKLLHALPISGIMSSQAVYNIILILLIAFAIKYKLLKFLWITIPVTVCNLTVLAGPVIYENVRYALPIIYLMPLVTAYFVYEYQGQCAEEIGGTDYETE